MRFQTLDMNLLVALDALFSERSVSLAARKLNMTQSGMSNALTRLRQHFGDELLIRVGNRMALTPAADALRPELQDILRRVRSLVQPHIFNPAQSERSVQILVEEYVPGFLLARFASQVALRAPNVELRIYTSRDDAADRLARGEADMLISSARVTVSGMPRLSIYTDEFICVVGPSHPFCGERMDLDEYLAQDHVKLFHGDRNKDVLGSIGINRRIKATLPNIPMLLDFVKETKCVATVLSRVLGDRPELRKFHPPFELPGAEVFVQWHQRGNGDPLIKWLCDLLQHELASGQRGAEIEDEI